MEQLITLLKMIAPMSAALEAHLRSIIRKHEYKKGDTILPLGSVCDQIFFIESGLVRSFHRHKGKEISIWFMKQGDVCIAVLSFFRRIAAMEAHVALEDCVCWGISHAELHATYALFPEFREHGRLLTQEYYCRSEERALDTKLKSALERYQALMDKDPDLILRVPNRYLASYIGMAERTLTKKKNEYLNKKKSGNAKK
ncbi:MAG TPA: Crp/Fnr family transcriptional regulator [Puia sp.]|uniref:Crp/Fnr family transcriptional regulator n=1 Tax=Puia sp. TaxID=2045100 RepID=UPI002C0A830E|nr:Crp/Fnr family transcriptional regulator [Puia sp.]HVU97986.1 Crp/Fnr family transcriptional regulator [Puia sp.]